MRLVPAVAVVTLSTTSHRPQRPFTVTPRPDLLGAPITVLAGVFGLLQLFLSWSSVVFSVNLPANGGLTGWQVFRAARAGASVSGTWAVGAYSVLAVGLVGGALIALGLVLLLPIDHRPPGYTALALSLISTAGAVFWLIRADRLTDHSLGELFSDAGPGWYLFLASGLVGVIGGVLSLRVTD